MTNMATAFQNLKIVSGWHYDGKTPDGNQKYRGEPSGS